MSWILCGFDWDDGNINKAQKHGVTLKQIESALINNPTLSFDGLHSRPLEMRFCAMNEIDGKWILIIFTVRIKDARIVYRVISARFAREKEVRKFYEKTKKQT